MVLHVSWLPAFFTPKNGRMEKTYIRICLAIIAGICTGCSEDYMELGNRWTEIKSRLIVIDTCTVELSTARMDSIVTSGGNVIYAGIRESEYWGTTDMSTYLTFKTTEDFMASSTPEYSREYLFDSLTLYLTPNGSFCGDTLKDMTLTAYHLTEKVELNDDSELYAHSSFGYEENPAGRLTFRPRPLRGSALELRLDDSMGKELLDKVVSSDEETESDDAFKEWFKGLMIKAGTSAQAILGFSSSDSLSMMKLYYRYRDYSEPVNDTLTFKIDTTCMFTHIDSDLSGTEIAGITKESGTLESGNTGNKAFVSGALGIYARIGFPYLNNLRSIGDHCKAASAMLTVYPLPGSYCKSDYSFMPESLNLYVSDENNISTGGAIASSDGETLQTGSLTYDDMMFPESTYYTYDITDFINSQMGKIGINKNFLQMVDPEYGYTINELVIGDQSNGNYNIRLTIELATYDE